MNDISIAHLYVSPGHNFFGHHGQPPGEYPTVEVEEVRCVTGRGVVGDRFYGHMPGYAGEITFSSWRFTRSFVVPWTSRTATRGCSGGTSRPGAFG